MDRKIGLPPSGSTMGNNALRIKNKLFAASTMTNLQPHSPAPNYAVPHRAAPSSATQHNGVSRSEPANTAHIITLVLKIFAAVVKRIVNEKSVTTPLFSRFPVPAADAVEPHAWRSNLFPHHHVGIAKRRNALKARFFEHRYRSVRRHISERLVFPISHRVSFDDPATLSFYGFESGRQCNACDAAPPIFSVDDKTSDAPKFPGFYFWDRHTIGTHIVDPCQFLARSVLTPPHRFAVRIDQNSMRAALVDEFFLLLAIPSGSQVPGRQPLLLGQRPRSVTMHTKAMVPPISLREKFQEVGPGRLRQFLRRQFHRSAAGRCGRLHFNCVSLSVCHAVQIVRSAATRRRRLSGSLMSAVDLRGGRARSRGSRRPCLLLSLRIRRARRSCLSLRRDAARRKSVQTRCEQVTLRCFLSAPLRGQKFVRIPASHCRRVLRLTASHRHQFEFLVRLRAHPSGQFSGYWPWTFC